MTLVGKSCLYCSKAIESEDRLAVCDRCFAAHHEECWERNGRCSTFRCGGLPRTMRGDDLPTVVHLAMERSNEQPQICPTCAGKVYAGTLQARGIKQAGVHPKATGLGLVFVGKGRPTPHKDWFGKNFLAKMLGNKSWVLAGAHVRARSCGKCRRLFVWGVTVDEAFIQKYATESGDRFCPHCHAALWRGEIPLRPRNPGSARFECNDPPDFHRDWIGHNLLDRYVLNKWFVAVPALPAYSCPDCQYTEVAGRPIYKFL